MRQLDERRYRRCDGRPLQQGRRRRGADVMERGAQFKRLLPAEPDRHRRQRLLLLLRGELMGMGRKALIVFLLLLPPAFDLAQAREGGSYGIFGTTTWLPA